MLLASVDSLSLVMIFFISSPSWSPLFPLHLTLMFVQLTAVPVQAHIQAPDCLPAALPRWNWVRISCSVLNDSQ